METGRAGDTIETVIIGAGIVGCALGVALVRRGYKDFVIVDRASVDAPVGSTGHAPGLLAQISASAELTALARRSVALYSEVPHARPAFSPVGSIEVARNEATMRRFADKLRRGEQAGIAAQLLTPRDIERLMPLVDASGLVGGVFVPGDGVLDARRALRGLADEIRAAGVPIREGTAVRGFVRKGGRLAAVQTETGAIACGRAVVAAGLWGASLLQAADIALPLHPVQHPYLTTEPLAALRGRTEEASLPLVRDLDHLTYYRQHGECMGYGWYNHAPLAADATRMATAELPYPEDAFQAALRLDLLPVLRETPVRHRLNGVFSMTPDGLPLLGPLRQLPGLWSAEAVWVTHAGGVAEVMADLLLAGRTSLLDASRLDANRFASLDGAAGQDRSLRLYNDIYHWPAV